MGKERELLIVVGMMLVLLSVAFVSAGLFFNLGDWFKDLFGGENPIGGEVVGDGYGSVCGNGVKESGEECDDGNLINGDGCDNECKEEEEEINEIIIRCGCDDSYFSIPSSFTFNLQGNVDDYYPGCDNCELFDNEYFMIYKGIDDCDQPWEDFHWWESETFSNDACDGDLSKNKKIFLTVRVDVCEVEVILGTDENDKCTGTHQLPRVFSQWFNGHQGFVCPTPNNFNLDLTLGTSSSECEWATSFGDHIISPGEKSALEGNGECWCPEENNPYGPGCKVCEEICVPNCKAFERCINNECVGVCDYDNECGEDSYGEDYCMNDKLYSDLHHPFCGSIGECDENIISGVVEDCTNYCVEDKCVECKSEQDCEVDEFCNDGVCVGDPCGDGTCDREGGEDCNNCEEDCGCPSGSEGGGEQPGVCKEIIGEGESEYECCYDDWESGEGTCECEEEEIPTCDCDECGTSFFGTRYRLFCNREECTKDYCDYDPGFGEWLSRCTPKTNICSKELSGEEPIEASNKFCDISSPFFMWEYPDSQGLWILEQNEALIINGRRVVNCIPQCTSSPGCAIINCKQDQKVNEETRRCECLDPEKRVNDEGICVCMDDDKILDKKGNCVCKDSDKEKDNYGNCVCKNSEQVNEDGECICENGQGNPGCEIPEVDCNKVKIYEGTCGKADEKEKSDCCVRDCEGKICGLDGCGGTCGSGCSYLNEETCEEGVAVKYEHYCYNEGTECKAVRTEKNILMDLEINDAEPYEVASPMNGVLFVEKGDRVKAEIKISYADSCTIKYPDGEGNLLTDRMTPAYGSREYEIIMNEPGFFGLHCDNDPCGSQLENNIDPSTGELANTLLKVVGVYKEKPVNDCEMDGNECANEVECPLERRDDDNRHACIHEGKVCCSKPDAQYSLFNEFGTGSLNPDADTPSEIVGEYVDYVMAYEGEDEKRVVKNLLGSVYSWGMDDTQNVNPSADKHKNLISTGDLEKLSQICRDYENAPNYGVDANPIQKREFETKKACMAYKLDFEEMQTYQWPMWQSIFPETEKRAWGLIESGENQKRRVRWNAWVVPGFNTYTVYLLEPEKIIPGIILLRPPRKWYQWPTTILRMEKNLIYVPLPKRKWYPHVTVPIFYSLKEASKNRKQDVQNINKKVAVLEIALYLVPFGESADQGTQGNWERAGIAAVRDIAGLLSGGTGKAASTFGKVVNGVARTTEVGFATYDMYPSAKAIYKGEGTTTDGAITIVNGLVIGGNLHFAINKGVKSVSNLGNVNHLDPAVRRQFIDALADASSKGAVPVRLAKLNKQQAKVYRAQWKQLDDIKKIEDPQEFLDELTKALELGTDPIPGTSGQWGNSQVMTYVQEEILEIDERDIIRIMGGSSNPRLNRNEWLTEAQGLIMDNPAAGRFVFQSFEDGRGMIMFPTIKVRPRDGGALRKLGDTDFEKTIKKVYASAILEESQHAVGRQFGKYKIAYVSPMSEDFGKWARGHYQGEELGRILDKIPEADIMGDNIFFRPNALNDEFIKAHPEVRRAYLRYWNEYKRHDFLMEALEFKSARQVVSVDALDELGDILYEAYRGNRAGYPKYQQEALEYLADSTRVKLVAGRMDAGTYRAMKNGNVVGTVSAFDSPTANSFGDDFVEIGWLASNEGENFASQFDETAYKLLHDAKLEGKKKIIAKTNRVHARHYRNIYGSVADATEVNDVARRLKSEGKLGFENVIEADEAREIIRTTYAGDPDLDDMLGKIKEGKLFEKIDFENGKWGVLDLEFTTFDVDKWYAHVADLLK